ncbi:hypothetical protein ABIA32_002325 [Streptacidiphilus sp. MAP12-20]|uniref:hypothetical protein n=1 Tax=Streptacidiphilus sp. MAP12-20 TaxID=3156299 RepID=UPI003516FD62
MNVYGMRAEYGRGGTVKAWHMMKDGRLTALCGRDLAADAATLTDHDWAHTSEPICHTCGALYLRQVPYDNMISA